MKASELNHTQMTWFIQSYITKITHKKRLNMLRNNTVFISGQPISLPRSKTGIIIRI